MPRQHCTNFPDIAQEESWANTEQKDKIARNRNTWFGNTYYNFWYSANMLNIRSCGFNHVQHCILNIRRELLIKFSKQIASTFAEIINGCNGDENPVKHLRWSSFRKSLLASEANSESCQISWMKLFAKIVKNEKPFTIFAKTSILYVWQGSEIASEERIHKFLNLTLRSQTLANIIEIFQNIYHVDLHFT